MLRESGVVDAGGYGLVLILAGVVAGLRGESERAARGRPPPGAARISRPHHEDSRYRYCTNFIVSGGRPRRPRVRAAPGGARRLRPRGRRRGDAEGPRPHRRARGRRGPLRGRRRGHQPRRRRHARADRRAAGAAGGRARPGLSPWPPATGCERLFAELGALRRRRRRDAQPVDLRAAGGDPRGARRRGPRPAQLLQRDHGRGARLRALREAGSGRRRRPLSRPACWPWSSSSRTPRWRRTPGGSRRRWQTIVTGGVAPAARDDAAGTLPPGDAVGFGEEEIVAWGGAGSTLSATMRRLAADAEIVTVIAGADAPIPLDEIDDPRSRRGRDRDTRGRPAELVVAASGPVGALSPEPLS